MVPIAFQPSRESSAFTSLSTAKLAGQLGIEVGQAVLFITRVGYNAQGKAVELTHSYCRNDYYDFVAEMRRE